VKRLVAFVGAVIMLGIGLTATAQAAPSAPVIKHFTVVMTKGINIVVTDGDNPGGIGKATSTNPTSVALMFPAGPGSMTLTPIIGALSPPNAACIVVAQETGTFSFSFTPTAMPGFRFGGGGDYTRFTSTSYERHGRRCDTKHIKNQISIIDAGATFLNAVG